MRDLARIALADRYAWALLSGRPTPYIWGGKNALVGLDCAGFVCVLLCAVGNLPWGTVLNADGLWQKFPQASVPLPGMLACFGSAGHATHVAWVTQVVDGVPYMIEEGAGGPNDTTEAQAAKDGAYLKLSPVGRRSDLLGFADPWVVAG